VIRLALNSRVTDENTMESLMKIEKNQFESRPSRWTAGMFTLLLLGNIMVGCGSPPPAANRSAFASPSQTAQSPANAGACGCPDIADMEARIQEANAVVPLYQAEISKLQAQGGSVLPYSQATYLQFQATLQPVLDAIANANGRNTFANGDTNGFCKVTPNPKATACMRSSTVVHETIHQQICKALSPSWWQSIFYGTWQQQIGLIGALQNEIAAYMAEINFLEAQLPLARQQCATGWRGEITRTFTLAVHTNNPPGPIRLGLESKSSTEEVIKNRTDEWVFQGELDAAPSITTKGRWSGTTDNKLSLLEDSAFQLGGACAGTVLKGHSDLEESENGKASGTASLFVTVANGVAHITVSPNPTDPPGKITASRSLQGWGDVVQNDCGHRVPTNDNPPPASQPYTQESVSIDVPVDPTHADKLSGTTGPQAPPGGLAATTTIQWDLTLGQSTRAAH
jgi:hypothetical protein